VDAAHDRPFGSATHFARAAPVAPSGACAGCRRPASATSAGTAGHPAGLPGIQQPGATPDEARSDFEKAGGLLPLLFWGTVLSILTWLPFMDSLIPFWGIWLMWCGPLLLFTALAALFRQPRGTGSAELPAEYLRYEQRTTPRWPSGY
jgi:hypothetical protein